MRHLGTLLSIAVLAVLPSCTQDDNRPVVRRPREGGTEIDEPVGGFRAVSGQIVYLPIYSSIYTFDKPQLVNLAATVSIRNADRQQAIVLTSIHYFDHDGKLLQEYLNKPVRIEPMAAVEFFVRESDNSGGVSPSFLIEWLAEEAVVSPVIESIMISTASNQGISFTSVGRVIADRSRPIAPPTEEW